MTTTIYACYGVLGHEREVIYSTHPTEICDKITVEIPEELEPYETEYSGIAVLVPAPWNSNTMVAVVLDKILTSTKDREPALAIFGWCYKLKRV